MYTFDFCKMEIDTGHANRLNVFQAAAVNQPKAGKRNKLWKLIEATECDALRGLYIPLSDDVRLPNRVQFEFGKVPPAPVMGLQESFPYRFFGNSLVLPVGDAVNASPSSRLTNPGFIVVTHEFDPEKVEHFDEIGSWFAGHRIGETIFDQAHNALKKYTEYRGYSVVYSGRRSYQIHFIFDTTKLVNVPYAESAEQRLCGFEEKAALMVRVYEIAWEATKAALMELNPPTPFDEHMDSPLQWRRSPFAIRQIEAGKAIFGLEEGEFVPQIVVREDISSRAYPDSAELLIDPAISFSRPFKRARTRPSSVSAPVTNLANDKEILKAIGEACVREWGEYPRLERIGVDGDGYALYFANHAADQNPSTVVKGAYRRLLIQPRGFFDDGDFYLPDNFTANDIVAHWSRVFGSRAVEIPFGSDKSKREIINAARADQREQIATDLSVLLHDFSGRDALLVNGTPGCGKSSGCLGLLKERLSKDEREPWEQTRLKAVLFCSVSIEQAKLKLEEYRQNTGGQAVLWKGFWTVYGEICADYGVCSIRNAMESNRPSDVWEAIEAEQPEVAQALKDYNEAMWGSVDSNKMVVIFTSVAVLEKWPFSRAGKAIWHPRFEEDMEAEQIDALADSYDVQVCVLDDYRYDNLIYHFSEDEYRQIKKIKEAFPNWSRLSRHQRQEGFDGQPTDLKVLGFERFNERAMLELGNLELLVADFAAIPYASDPTDASMYRRQSGKVAAFYRKAWLSNLSCPKVFLTTERVVAAVTRALIPIERLIDRDLAPTAGIHPVNIPLISDARAVARQREALVDEIIANTPGAVIICNGFERDDARAINFEVMKGRNELSDKDIFMIMTMLAPEEYLRLNTLGLFLGRKDIIQMHYRDLLTQATGRNTGYRDTGNGRKTVVIQCGKLARAGYFTEASLNEPDAFQIREFAKYPDRAKPWLTVAAASSPRSTDQRGTRGAIATGITVGGASRDKSTLCCVG